MPDPERAPVGRETEMVVTNHHFVNGNPIKPPFAEGLVTAIFALGCFWGAERKFWQLPGVYTTAVGYAGGLTPNATYAEVCSGMTGHTEVVLVVYDPDRIRYQQLLRVFWEFHDPTQGMRQGNDRGSQYRSAIYTHSTDQLNLAEQSRLGYQEKLTAAGYGVITTEITPAEIMPAPDFYYAEDAHQQYLAKNPNGYCALSGTGVGYD